MFPDTHPQAVSDVGIQSFTHFYHTPDFEVVYPSSDELIQLLNLVAVRDSPASARQFLHLRLKLRN